MAGKSISGVGDVSAFAAAVEYLLALCWRIHTVLQCETLSATSVKTISGVGDATAVAAAAPTRPESNRATAVATAAETPTHDI